MRFHLGMSFKPKDIIKWIGIIGMAILGFMQIYTAKAEVIDNYGPGGAYDIYANNTSIKYRWITVQSGSNTDVRLAYQTPGNPLGCIPTNEGGKGCYVRYTLCVDSDIDTTQAVSTNVKNITFSKTSTSCSYYNSSYTGGTIAYLDYWVDPVELEDTLASVRYSNTIRLKFTSAVSIQANQVEIQEEKFNISLGEVADSINDNMDKNTDIITQAIINGTTATNDLNDTITDPSIDMSQADSFFGDFEDEDFGLSGIIKAPLVVIRGLNDGSTCNPLTFDVLGSSVSMPSGCILWDNVPSNVENIYFVLVGGFLAYILVISLFKDINRLKDPNKSEVDTLDL